MDSNGFKWVSVTESLPLYKMEVLVITNKCECAVAYLDPPPYGAPKGWTEWSVGDAISSYDAELCDTVTHWMPLPTRPNANDRDQAERSSDNYDRKEQP